MVNHRRAWILFPSLLVAFACLCESVHAQASAELPRLEYYVARDLFDSGNISEATEGFRTAINRGQQVKGQRWVDAVPALVMLGECYYQQGAIAQALEQYDAALMILLTFPNWADVMRGPEVLQEVPTDVKGINWARQSRKTAVVRVPSVMQVALDPTKVAPGVNMAAGGTAILRVDVGEVLRCVSVALRRRVELLGPLAKHSPLALPLSQLFSKPPQADIPWVRASWQALHGMSLMATSNDAQAVAQLQAGSSIENRADYCLTAPCLISLASIDVQQGNLPNALSRASDATLRAAQLEQADTLSECFALTGQIAAAGNRTDLLASLQAAAQWSQNYSVMPYLSASAAVCELAATAGNVAVHEAAAKQMLGLLAGQGGGQNIALPRVQAQLGYAMARAAANQNRLPLAEQQLETSLSLLRGNPMTGAATARSFQIQLTLELLNKGNLMAADAEALFDQLLAEPSQAEWRRWPLECLVCISQTHLPAYFKHLELSSRRGAAEEIVARMDAVQRERFCELLPLGGRLLAARQTLHADRNSWSAEVTERFEPLLKRHTTARSAANSMRELLDQLGREPMVVEDRGMSADCKKRFSDLVKLTEAEENALMTLVLERSAIPRHWPAPISLAVVQQSLTDRDVVFSFVHTPTMIHAIAISRTSQHVWSLPESSVLDAKIALLLTQIGVGGAPNLDVTSANLPWRTTAGDLARQLLPAEARQMASKSERIIVVPSGNLWYLPFDLLPLSDTDNKTPMLARHAVCYLPQIAYVRSLNQPAPTIRNTVGIYNAFFATDRTVNQGLCGQIAADSSSSLRMDTQVKSQLALPAWLRIRSDQIWVASELPMGKTPWELRVLPVEPSRDNALANWMQCPLKVPARLMLPGLQTSAQRVEMSGGNELFVPACTFMACGVRTAWVSRWRVGGRSSHAALSRVVDELQLEAPSSAWQRAAKALWAEKLPTADEPILPAAKGLPATVDGNHPLLWSGYMMIGDTAAPN